MLIEFSVSNYGSIKDEMTLSAETGERLSRLKETNTIVENNSSLLKSLVIVGPNGSGKSNLISGLKRMKTMVLNEQPRITDKLPFNPFILDDKHLTKETKFSVHFNYNDQEFEYSFSYQNDKIIFEELKQIVKTTENIYYSREGQSYPILPDNLKNIAKSTKQNSLFLHGAQKANDPFSISIMKWFKSDLIFVDDQEVPDELSNLMKSNKIKTEFVRFLKFADFNIIDVNVREDPMPIFPEKIKEFLLSMNADFEIPETTQHLYAMHKKYDSDGNVIGTEEIPLSRESRGTQKVFLIALSIINAQLAGNGKTLIFDEFDDSLHFELSKALLQIFNSKQNRNQFILTTHELQLLNSELRTDQIYLMEKDFQGRSIIKSIFDFKDSRKTARHDVKFMKRYIEGRFGSTPNINVKEMLSSINAEND